MKNKEDLQKYFNDNYYNKNNNYQVVLSKIREERKMNRKNIFKTIISTIIALLGTTSIVFASTKIYNEFIKKQSEIDSMELFKTEEGAYADIPDMIWSDNANMYYKILTNMEDYNIYKSKMNELPEMSKENFDTTFLVVIANINLRQPHETDLIISDVTVDGTKTHIIMKQKENPNYEKINSILYAIVDKALLRDDIILEIEYNETTSNKNLVRLESLPDNYSIEDALRDGCFVAQDYNILSENKHAIDELMEKSQNGEESMLRIYSKSGTFVRIMDLEFKSNIFVLKERNSDDKSIKIYSHKYLIKNYISSKDTYEYYFKDFDVENYMGHVFMTVKFD